MVTVLGVSASLRGGRFGRGSVEFCEEVRGLGTTEDLLAYLARETRLRLDEFIAAGRERSVPFSEIYLTLRRRRHERGLSNSEGVLAAGLWGARQAGATIEHCGLARHFPASGVRRDLETLREKVRRADAILLSGPVYFGDRGSLAQDFLEFLREDAECAARVRDRVYGGIAVGAKRNGGQETTLIYQLVDTTNLNMLAVGNDSETTSQYGGTAVAGDVGTVDRDREGIETSVGTGRRVGRVARMLQLGAAARVSRPVRIAVWLLQDTRDHRGRTLVERLCRDVSDRVPHVQFDVGDFTEAEIGRCLACDICPEGVGRRDEYRCVVRSPGDLFLRRHESLIAADAVLLGAYSPVDRRRIRSVYQRFVERTRYLRRDDYVFGDMLTAPLVITEVNSNQNLHIRMLTSFIRHLTVLHHPLIGVEFRRELLNWDLLVEQGVSFARNAVRLTAGRDALAAIAPTESTYRPLGYVVSTEKVMQDQSAGRTRRRFDEAARRTRKAGT